MKKIPLTPDEEAYLQARQKYFGVLDKHNFTINDAAFRNTSKKDLDNNNKSFKSNELKTLGDNPQLREIHIARDEVVRLGSNLLKTESNTLADLDFQLGHERDISIEQHAKFNQAYNEGKTRGEAAISTVASATSTTEPGSTATAASAPPPPPPPPPRTSSASTTSTTGTAIPADATTSVASATAGTTPSSAVGATAPSTPTADATTTSETPPAARGMTAAQKSARESAQSSKASYQGSLSESSLVLGGSALPELLEQNDKKFRQLPHGNNNAALEAMEKSENQHLGSLSNEQKSSLKQVQESRRNYMNSAMASTRTAERHDALSGKVPFEIANKQKRFFSEKNQPIVENYFNNLSDRNLAKKAVMARREAKASKEAAASVAFLENMEAKRKPTVDATRDAAGGFTDTAASISATDPTTAADLDRLAKGLTATAVADDAEAEAGLVSGSARTAEAQTEEQKTGNLYDEIQKDENKDKEIVYHSASGQSRITCKNGIFSSKDPAALAKFVASQGHPDFKITHGDGPTALSLLDNLIKEGVQDISMTPEMRAKIKTAGGEEQIRIAEARSQTFKNTSVVQQSEHSLNALTFTSMTNPKDADARAYLNREYCTNEDRKDMISILKEKLEKGEITQQEFVKEAKEVLSVVNEDVKSELTADLTPELQSAIERPSAETIATAAATGAPSPDATSTTAAATTTAPDDTSAPAPTPAPTPAPAPTPPKEPEPAPSGVGAGFDTPRTDGAATASTASSAAPPTAPSVPNKPLPSTPAPAPTPEEPGRPDWTRMGMGAARNTLQGTHAHENKSSELASSILGKFTRQGDNLQMLQKYLSGVKNFLNGGENKTQTNFIETVAALAIANPATVPAILPNLSPPELKEVANIISKEEKKVENADTALKNFSDDLEDWKDDHPKSSSDKDLDSQENKDPNASKQQDNQEVKEAEKKLVEAKEKIEEKKEQPKQESVHEEERSPTPHGKG